MNAADDKQNKVNGVKDEDFPSSSTMCPTSRPIEKTTPQAKQNGGSLQNSECSKHPITNGAYPKVKTVSCIATSTCENGGPSGLRKNLQLTNAASENLHNDINCGESEKGLLLRNTECHPESDSHTVNTQKHKPKDRVVHDYDRNSSSEDEECCIYTYKGDSNQMADLPRSFFKLDFMPAKPNANSRNSSPDMDYLEMDFDPGPSNDRYSSSDSECVDRLEGEEQFEIDVPLFLKPQENCESVLEPPVEPDVNPSTPLSPLSTPSPVGYPRPQAMLEQPYLSGEVWSPPASPLRQPTTQDADGDVLQPSYCYCVANKLSPISIDENFNDGDAGTMIWKEHEAREKQVTQIGVSACGATAVINALLGLNIQFSVDDVKHHVATRFRSETAPLPEYLMSRCNAGATHVDMIRGLQCVSHDLVYARFFHMYPQRSISLTSWLSHWIRKGAVPIATLNLQRGLQPDAEIPDVWHHQMVYGVGARGIYLTNPLEVHSESRLWPQLASPSVMLVRRDDVLSRWTPNVSLHSLIDPCQPLWRKMNVLGQVVNMIRENSVGSLSTRHITIPASYSSGITLAVLRSSPAYDELRLAPELPIDPFASS